MEDFGCFATGAASSSTLCAGGLSARPRLWRRDVGALFCGTRLLGGRCRCGLVLFFENRGVHCNGFLLARRCRVMTSIALLAHISKLILRRALFLGDSRFSEPASKSSAGSRADYES